MCVFSDAVPWSQALASAPQLDGWAQLSVVWGALHCLTVQMEVFGVSDTTLTSLSTQDLKKVHGFILMTDDKFFPLTLYPVSRASAQEKENTGKI